MGIRIDSSGIVILDNPAAGLWSDSDRWMVEEDLRIGSVGGEPDYQFGQIGAIAVASDGEILVSDRQLRQVKVFTSEGRFLRAMGRPGSGPGEFGRGPLDLLLTPGDTLLVPDGQNRRINRFDPDGGHLASYPLDPARDRPLRFNWNAETRSAAVQVRPVGGGTSAAATDAIRTVRTSGAFGDTLLTVPSGGLFEGGGLRYFTPEPAWDITDSLTVVYAVNSEYSISFHDREGSPRRIVRKVFEAQRITERDIGAIFVYLDRAWLAAGVPPDRLEANHQRVAFAEFFPAFFSFDLGYEGSLWVQPVRSPGGLSDAEIERYDFVEDFGDSAWEVFDRDGRFLGIVNMPPRFQPRLFHKDAIYGVLRDDLDVQHVVRLRVRGRQDG